MERLFVRVLPGIVVAAAAATAAVIALRTLARWRGERDWASAWEAYQRDNR
jgi:hypothetical protein